MAFLTLSHVTCAAAPKRRWHRVEVRIGRGTAVLLNQTFQWPHGTGARRQKSVTYRELLPCPTERAGGVLTVSMVNEHGQYFEDAIAVTFNEGFEQVLKWVTLIPFATAVAAVTIASLASAAAPLPI